MVVEKNKTRKGRAVRRHNFRRVLLVFGIIGLVALIAMGGVALVSNWLGPGEIVFSLKSGFYDDTKVEIGVNGFLPMQSIEIRFNMNGDDILSTNEIYDGEIKLEAPESGYRVYTITAAACKDDECTGQKTATYVLGKNLENDIGLNVININSAQVNLYDYYYGIMVGGSTFDYNSLFDDGALYKNGNYNNRGDDWVRSAYATEFNSKGELIYDGAVNIEISGGTSSMLSVKSLKLTTFYDDSEGGSMREMRLRAGQDQFSGNIRSSVASRLASESGFDDEPGTERLVVFLNGDFYGIFDKQMNYSKQNLANKYNIRKKKYIKKHKWSEEAVFASFGVENEIWKDLGREENREKLEEVIDMDSYLKYFAIQILLNNTDWPSNNFGAWRYEGQKSDNKYEDGRLRFLLYDMDMIYYTKGNLEHFNGAISDNFENLMEQEYGGEGSMFYKVMKLDYYREKFIALLRELINGPFATENVLKIIDEEAEKIEHQVKLFYSENEYEEWKGWIELMRKAASERNDNLRELVEEYFDVVL